MTEKWPLIGREEDLQRILDAVAGGASGVVLSGAAGVGKTRVALAAMERFAEAGCATRWLIATRPCADIPFGTLASILPDSGPGQHPDGDIVSCFLRIRQALTALGQGRQLVLGIDDAHHLDPASAALVHQLTSTGVARTVVTVRTAETVPEPITKLWKDGLAERLDIQPLDRSKIEELLSTILGGQLDGGLVHELAELADGNILFLSVRRDKAGKEGHPQRLPNGKEI